MAKKKQSTPKKTSAKAKTPRAKKPEVEEFMEIGGSPAPGITLRQVLRGHTEKINEVSWSPDGRYLASPSNDKTIRIWDLEKDTCIAKLEGHSDKVTGVDWSPDGNSIVTSSYDKTIRIWNTTTWQNTNVLEGHTERVNSVAWAPDGSKVASCSHDESIIIWQSENWKILKTLNKHSATVWKVIWALDSKRIASVSDDSQTIILDIYNNEEMVLETERFYDVTCDANFTMLAAGGQNGSINIIDAKHGKVRLIIEGHTNAINCLSFSNDFQLLATNSFDETVRVWRCDTWETLAILKTKSKDSFPYSLAFNPTKNILASPGLTSNDLYIWSIDTGALLGDKIKSESISYTTAKVILVGDSGVGKTGLGWRLAHNEFKEHSSTHGQQFWVVPELKKTRKDGTECEAVLWDLAGQHIYRSIHSIFLDDVDASLVLFDPTNRQEPLKGAQFWLEQLKGKKQLPPSVLVGARLDRGAPVLSQQELDQFCQKYGISGGYIGTSAKSGEGLDKLLESLKDQIPWDKMTTTVTTVTFKNIKEYVLKLKENTRRKKVLVSPSELRKKLETTDKKWKFTDDEMMTAVRHLENHGYVSILRSSSGEKFILLVPELLVSLASSIFLLADKHPQELGAINEAELLQGKFQFSEFEKLTKKEQLLLLDVAVVRFLEHSICFREKLGSENLLIFPSLIKQKRPLKDDTPSTDDISYVVRGKVENIYAILVVLLGYTSSFTRRNHWQKQAQYETNEGKICGFKLIEDREGEIELILYFGNDMSQQERDDFQRLFEQFLYQREVEVTPFPPVICPNGHRQERATVIKRSQEGKQSIFCDECGVQTDLSRLQTQQTIGIQSSSWLKQEEAIARLRNTYEAHLARVKGYRRGREIPRCFISKVAAQKTWAKEFVHDLSDAGVYIIEDASKVSNEDTVIILDSPAYQKAWKSKALDHDEELIQSRLSTKKLISIAVQGKPLHLHDIRHCEPGDFCDETHYPVSLFDLVLNLYAIPFSHTGFAPLRQSLHQQWEQSLAGKKGKEISTPLKVFISYSHKDEEFKDELVTMLASLQRRGVIDAWQDRRIEEGDEWYQDIQDAMNDYELAILLVSANFLASRFITDEELPKLLKRRMEEDLRVVPIIVKQCLWQSEPVIKDLQVMPRDGKPVITFSKDNGERDQVWTDIAKAIEKRAKK